MNDIIGDWYSRRLKEMSEPSLSVADVKAETYRFVWLSELDRWMSLRLTIAPDRTAELVTKKSSRYRRSEFGPLAINKRTQISQRETEILLELLEQTNFWDLASYALPSGFDGDQWIVEGVRDGKYHVVERWSGRELRDWVLLLMEKSGADLQPID
ncbi:hypothetical protein G5V57_00725 [Nordella sp. HKS 07]|uniref:hypothetical protein n=1 Tax=Nordella sp. HKS 07 TaxID=2712222 RepID=UPI0013E18CF5|nr:hypothetical protein [Nordella sp. HKS 07]QIG46407.1 hypothetical protein G5V57_00725 [Nordella sp. HKS 07]